MLKNNNTSSPDFNPPFSIGNIVRLMKLVNPASLAYSHAMVLVPGSHYTRVYCFQDQTTRNIETSKLSFFAHHYDEVIEELEQQPLTTQEFLIKSQNILKAFEKASITLESEDVYKEIFSMHNNSGLTSWKYWTNWYDPDTTYEEDVRAYISHLNQMRDKAILLLEVEKEAEPSIVEYPYDEEGNYKGRRIDDIDLTNQ